MKARRETTALARTIARAALDSISAPVNPDRVDTLVDRIAEDIADRGYDCEAIALAAAWNDSFVGQAGGAQ